MSDLPSTSKFDCFDVDEESEEGEINDDDDEDEEEDDLLPFDKPKDDLPIVQPLLFPPEVEENDTHLRGQKRRLSEEGEPNSEHLERLSINGDPAHIESDDELAHFTHKDIIKEITMEAMNNRITITTVDSAEACTHEVANPPSHPYVPLLPPKLSQAKTYPFILDPFQKEAILCIDNNQSVLVSAHTSAGKTVVAEYAIASSLRAKQRVIYTTPIKALSNQKYREFSEEFKDVGLITGDVTINQNSSCLIMTTEILRNMLYRGSEVTREVGWVIFDEIHYMRDKERGVVWEETIILLPRNVHFVFLSATIPNARQFAEWICSLHNQACHVVYTDYRPTPLQHFIFPSGGDGIHLVLDEKGQFREDNFSTAMAVLQNAGDNAKGDSQRGRKGGMKGASNSNVYKVVKMIMERNFAPVIVFSFSKKDCELFAMQLAKLDFNTNEEKKLVDEVFNNAIDVLKPEDKQIPQVENVLPFLRRGIGIHHGGLLPILKETIEIMFSEGLIKALFATETFAMGLNMPARTVVFTGMRKYDGKEYRWISSGEYIQMSGRAGRRGLDDKGIVILMVDEKVTPTVGKNIVKGLPDPINSAFQLTYNMVLNLLRVEEINPEFMMERSFFQFQNQSCMPELYEKYEAARRKCDAIKVSRYEEMKTYHELRKSIEKLKAKCRKIMFSPLNIIPFLKSGRMVRAKHDGYEFDWGIVVNFNKTVEPNRGRHKTAAGDKRQKTDRSQNINLTVDILLHLEENDRMIDGKYVHLPCPKGKIGTMEVIAVPAKNLLEISSVRVHIPDDLRPLDARLGVIKMLEQVKQRFKDGVPLLNPITDMKITDPKFVKHNDELVKFQDRLNSLPIAQVPNIEENYKLMLIKIENRKAMRVAREELSCASSILQMDELKNRKKVLRRLGFSDENDIIQVKGRVACELSGADELLLTEMIFAGTFDDLPPELAVSLLSCFVCDEKSSKNSTHAETLAGALRNMQHIARKIAKISRECSINIDEDQYVDKFKASLMDVVYAWSQGASFLELCKMTEVFEGSIIRCIRRLEELLRQLCQAAKGIGNIELESKFAEGIRLIKRDIVFAASLYL